MFLVSEEVFAEVCADQGVQLNDEFAVEASWTKDDLDFPYRDYYMPTDMIEHAAWAGRILRRHPDEKLATGVIKVADTPLAEDLAARLVVGMINDSIEHPEPALGAISKIDTDSKRVGTCETAEPQFVATLMHIAKAPPDEVLPAEIFVADDTPVLIRKFLGEASALLLKDVAINNICYRRGALMSMVARGDTSGPGVTDGNMHVRNFSDIEQLAFMRPSFFSFPIPFRRLVFDEYFTFTPEDMEAPDEKFVPERRLMADLPAVWPQVIAQDAVRRLKGVTA